MEGETAVTASSNGIFLVAGGVGSVPYVSHSFPHLYLRIPQDVRLYQTELVVSLNLRCTQCFSSEKRWTSVILVEEGPKTAPKLRYWLKSLIHEMVDHPRVAFGLRLLV